jgi:branched-chain amino acid transport system ATP-binding protein
MAELLHVDKLWAGYGDAVVLEDVSFTLNEGDSLSLLGRNGMGKTTAAVHPDGCGQLPVGQDAFCRAAT